MNAHLPHDASARKDVPMVTGLLDYFPDALADVAHLSKVGNDQHNPGQPLHWAREKSTDHADALLRHLVDRGRLDADGVRHSAKVAWRALANLQVEIETDRTRAEAASELEINPSYFTDSDPIIADPIWCGECGAWITESSACWSFGDIPTDGCPFYNLPPTNLIVCAACGSRPCTCQYVGRTLEEAYERQAGEVDRG